MSASSSSSSRSLLDPDATFATLCASLHVDPRIRKAVARMGLVRPTLVQSRALPLAIAEGRDLLVRARTGSGKTLAYLIPILHKVLRDKERRSDEESENDERDFCRAVVLVPTRELVRQVRSVFAELCRYCDEVVTCAALSSASRRDDAAERAATEAALRDRPDVIVSTPGGLAARLRDGALRLSRSVRTLAVDEADLVLDFGHAEEVREIARALPNTCQGVLLSATLSPEVEALKRVVLRKPAVLRLEEGDDDDDGQHARLRQYYVALPKKDKFLLVYVFLKLGLLKGKGLFFVNSTDAGYRLKLFLELFHIRSAVLNAELPARSRASIVDQFNADNFDYLVATDDSARGRRVAAAPDDGTRRRKPRRDAEYGVGRGADFRNVSFVLNVDVPAEADAYAHRIGRTARGGAKGVALTLAATDDAEETSALEAIRDAQPPLPLSNDDDDDVAPATTIEGDRRNPAPLAFALDELEGFRYRVEDVGRAVTRAAVREARAAELRAEMLNSERSAEVLDERDLEVLRHDRVASTKRCVHEHLRNVPSYMLPRGREARAAPGKRRRRKRAGGGGARKRERGTTTDDPLQPDDFRSGTNDDDDNVAGEDGFFGEDDEEENDKPKKKPRVFLSTHDDTGTSTSGRQAWKKKHGKGKFNKKYKKVDVKW